MFFSGLKLTFLYSFLGIAGSIFIGLYYRSNEYLLMLVVFYALILIPLILLLDWLERRVRYGTFGNWGLVSGKKFSQTDGRPLDVRLDCRRIAWVRTFAWNFSWRFADFEKCSASNRPSLVSGIFQNRSDDRAALFGLLHFAAAVSCWGFGWVDGRFGIFALGFGRIFGHRSRSAGISSETSKISRTRAWIDQRTAVRSCLDAASIHAWTSRCHQPCDARRQNDVLADDHQRDGRHQRWTADHRGKQSAISKRSFLDLRIYFHAVFHRWLSVVFNLKDAAAKIFSEPLG